MLTPEQKKQHRAEAQRRWRAKNRERVNELNLKWRAEHPEVSARWYAKNKQRQLEYQKKYAVAHRGKINEQARIRNKIAKIKPRKRPGMQPTKKSAGVVLKIIIQLLRYIEAHPEGITYQRICEDNKISESSWFRTRAIMEKILGMKIIYGTGDNPGYVITDYGLINRKRLQETIKNG